MTTLRKPAGAFVRWNYKSQTKLERDSIDRACGLDSLSSGSLLRSSTPPPLCHSFYLALFIAPIIKSTHA